jgi:hypothetical protein
LLIKEIFFKIGGLEIKGNTVKIVLVKSVDRCQVFEYYYIFGEHMNKFIALKNKKLPIIELQRDILLDLYFEFTFDQRLLEIL